MNRDTWTASFRDVVYALDYPERVAQPPVITQPEVIPGTQVHIPDLTLLTMIAEALGKNVDDPITVDEIKGLTRLESNNRRVHNLTGLQFATNLAHLELDNSRVSDISPLKGLTKLSFLEVHGGFSDLSFLSGLANLKFLDVSGSKVSDLSPLAGLTNLNVLLAPDGVEVVLPPAVIQGGFLHIPDPNLRAVLEEALGTKAITPSAMATLTTLKASDRGIFNLAGLEFAVNLQELWISDNPVSDLSPLSGCTNLIRLFAWPMPNISDLSPLENLTELEQLEFRGNIKDISPLVRLTNLRVLQFYGGHISDISPLSGMTKLERVRFRHNEVNDISPLAMSANLEWLDLHDNKVSDLSPLRNLTKLEFADLADNRISDVSALAGLFNLHELRLARNKISNISPLAELTNLKFLDVEKNQISDFSPLFGLGGKTAFTGMGNPGYPKRGPKIEGPWLWLHLPNRSIESNFDIDLLSEVSGDTVTEIGIATSGATAGDSVVDEVWTSHKLPTTGEDNIKDMLGRTQLHGAIYGNVSLYSPAEQNTSIQILARQRVKVWLNGTLIYQRDRLLGGHPEFFPATLKQGRNVLLIATDLHRDEASYGFLDLSPTQYIR